MSVSEKVKVGISQGDLNGVGLEVVLKSFSDPAMMELCTPVLFSSAKTISFYKKLLNLPDFNYTSVRDTKTLVSGKFNVLNCYEEDVLIEPGKATEHSGKYAYLSLEKAASALQEKHIDVLVTAPVNKNNIKQLHPSFIGHTEYLDQKFGQQKSLMLMVSDNLKIAVATGHVPLSEVASLLDTGLIIRKTELLLKSLKQDFSVQRPRIAILGLNPHAGDNGAIGKEDSQVILPAIKYFEEKGQLVFGPYSPDAFFGSGQHQRFDAVLAMYHDQGLIPFKTIAFGSGVNFTAGLSVIRTSPDHGTAYDIAGKALASEDSFRQAIYLACDIFKNRTIYERVSADPLRSAPQKNDVND